LLVSSFPNRRRSPRPFETPMSRSPTGISVNRRH
jgi:hypothetical protein